MTVQLRQRLRGAVILVACFAAVTATIVVWLKSSDVATLRGLLTRWQFWVLETQFVLLAVFSWLNIPDFVRSLRLGRSSVMAVVAVSVVTLILVAGVAPRTNRIYYDEHIYQGIAQNLSDLHLAQMCNDGTVEFGVLRCRQAEYNKQPYGYPYVLSLGYRMLGVHEWIAHAFNAACAVVLLWVVFLTTAAAFDDPRAGAFAALVAALIPQQILWSHTAASEPSAALTIAIALMAAVAFTRARTGRSLLWMVAAAVFATQFRTESVLVVPVIALVVAVFFPEAFSRASFWWAALLGLVLCAPYLAHLAAVRYEAWGASGDRMALGFFWPNLKVNASFFLDNMRFPLLYTLLAAWGAASSPTRAVAFPLAYFAAFWGVFLFFYAGSYDFGADVRFSLMSYPAVAMLAGRGAAALQRLAPRTRLETVIVAAIVVQFLWFMPQVRAVGEEAWAARADVAFAQQVMPELPTNSVVLTQNPSVFLIRGVNAAQLSLATTDRAYVGSVLPARYAGGVFLHWNFWCNTADDVQPAFCEAVLDQFRGELFREHGERDYRYAFFRLETGQPKHEWKRY